MRFIFYLLPKYAPSFASPHYNFCLLGKKKAASNAADPSGLLR